MDREGELWKRKRYVGKHFLTPKGASDLLCIMGDKIPIGCQQDCMYTFRISLAHSVHSLAGMGIMWRRRPVSRYAELQTFYPIYRSWLISVSHLSPAPFLLCQKLPITIAHPPSRLQRKRDRPITGRIQSCPRLLDGWSVRRREKWHCTSITASRKQARASLCLRTDT